MNEICPSVNCSGCEVCANICPHNCISFVQDQEGFFYPSIDQSKCVDCKLCQKVCPANSPPLYNAPQDEVFAAWALDNKIRQSSSSGGLYSVFANYCFSQGGVANGVIFNDKLLAVHALFDSPEKIISSRGSKYVQSSPGDIYKRIKSELNQGRTVFFTSTPCQVNALYKYLDKDYANLYTCDFVCHGVPSPQFLKDCVLKMTSGNTGIDSISFRNLSGWGKFGLKVNCANQICDEKLIDSVYIRTFLAGVNYRYSCYQCPFTRQERVADITIGDFWGLGKYKPFLHDMRHGVSLLIINSPKGKALVEKIKDKILLEKRSFREAARDNHQLHQRITMPKNRSAFYSDVKTLSDREVQKKHVPPIPLLKKLFCLPLRIVSKVFRTVSKVIYIILKQQ